MSNIRITSFITVNIERIPVSNRGKKVYKSLVSTNAKTADDLARHMKMDAGNVSLGIAELLRHDLVTLETDETLEYNRRIAEWTDPFFGRNNGAR